MENDYDFQCMTCNYKITVPLGQKTPPRKCEKCGDTWCYLSKETIEENELINSEES